MPTQPASQERDITTLSREQRDWIRRQAQVARALEAAQRREGRRFARNAGELRRPQRRPPAP